MDLDFDERKELEYSDKDSDLSRSARMPIRDAPPVGILRLDVLKPRRSSVEFRYLTHGEPTSPQPSVDRLSVTFAEDSQRSDISSRCNLYNPNISPLIMDKVHFPERGEVENSDDEDYSASVSAILQRRASTRRSKRKNNRRTSSPYSPDILPGTENERRRSSCYTNSSGETAISVEDNLVSEVTQAQIYENIRLHKDVLSNVKMQPWHMRKKIRLVVQAKNYIKKHEGVLQERLAQSHSTKDMLASWNLYIIKRWQRVRRETANLYNWLIPWELRIKEIESHFGSVVASYFTFLRWLFWVNLVTAIILTAFVTIPELLTADQKAAGDRKQVLKEDRYNATNFYTLMDFEGILKYSPVFYGWYTNKDVKEKGYRLPLAYFMTGLAVYVYNFVATLRKMAENSRMSKLSEKEDECIFSWKVFTGWDYMIGNSETAANRVASIVMGFKEALLEEAEKKKNTKNWKVILIRIVVNISVCGLLALSAFAVVIVVKRSTEAEAKKNFWRMNEITIVMNLISLFFPMIFEVLGLGEQYHPRKQLRLQLARIMLLNLLNLYALNFALFDKIKDMQTQWPHSLPNDHIFNVSNCSGISSVSNISKLEFARLESNPYDEELLNRTIENSYKFGFNFSKEFLTSVLSMKRRLKKLYGSSDIRDEVNLTTESFTTPSSFHDLTNTQVGYNSSEITDYTTTDSYNSTTEKDNLDFRESFRKIFENLYLDEVTGIPENFSQLEVLLTTTDYILNATDSYENVSMFETFLTTIYDKFTETDGFSSLINERADTTTDQFLASTEGSTTSAVIATTIFQHSSDGLTSETSTPTSKATETTHINYNTTQSDVSSTVSTKIMNNNRYCADRNVSIEDYMTGLDYQNRSKVRSLCWETMFGQELVKLTVMDLFMTILSTLAMDFLRGVFVRVMNNCWCWDLEKIFPQYGDFKVAENILHLVNNQGMVWMGMFFSPGIITINVVKLYIMVYFRSWIVLTCNVPHKVVFRASRSNNFYYALLLSMLFLCVIPVGYAIVWVRPSPHCGPFSKYPKIFEIFTRTLKEVLPEYVHQVLDYIASPSIVIPLLVLMILIIYYLVSLTDALREANNDLKIQLRRERTEERRKMFQIVDRRRRIGSEGSGEMGQNPYGKWKKLLYNLPSGKSFDETPKQESEEVQGQHEEKSQKPEPIKTKDFFSKLLKRALKKSVTSDDEEATDTDPQDSLPDDVSSVREVKPQAPVKKPFAIKKDLSFKRSIHGSLTRKSSQDTTLSVEFDTSPTPITAHSSRNRRDSFDLKKHQEKKRISKSPAKCSITKEHRDDSLTSTWSDNIPVITISKTDSTERVDDVDKRLHDIEERISTTSSDTLMQERVDTRPKSRYILKKQQVTEDEDVINQLVTRKFSKEKKNEERIDEDIASANVDTKTESSNDYKDSVFS